jgi:FMN reductase
MSTTSAISKSANAQIVTIGGSPSTPSRTQRVLDYATAILREDGASVSSIQLRDIPAEALLYGRATDNAVLAAKIDEVAKATGLVIATPVYKAAYTGVLKAFLDQLPENALLDKVVLPIALGGSVAHTLMLDYSLKPVLSALGARLVVDGVFIPQRALRVPDAGPIELDDDIDQRLRAALHWLSTWLPLAEAARVEANPARTSVASGS